MGNTKHQLGNFEKVRAFTELFSTGQIALYWLVVLVLQILVITVFLSHGRYSAPSVTDIAAVDDPVMLFLVVMGLSYAIQIGTAVVLLLPTAFSSRRSRKLRWNQHRSASPWVRWLLMMGFLFILAPVSLGVIWLIFFIKSVSSTAALLIALIILLASLDQKNNLGLITKTKKQWYIARAGGIALALLSFVVFHLESLLPVLDTGEMAVVYVFGAYVFTLLDSIIGLPLFIYEGVMQSRRSGPAASELQQRAREIERELRSE